MAKNTPAVEAQSNAEVTAFRPGRQTTVACDAEIRGVGFVTGAEVEVKIRPAEANTGYLFVRTDLPGKPQIPAHFSNVSLSRRRTALHANGATVEMVEHCLSALAGLGVDNAIIELNAGELPGLDGSSLAFVDAIMSSGIKPLDVPKRPLQIEEPVCAYEKDALVAIHPGVAGSLAITFNLDLGANSPIPNQSLATTITPEFYRKEIAPARTFVLESEVAALRAQGLGSRITAKDLLVIGSDGNPIDNQYRMPDECVRHKILDVVGDLALFGQPLFGHVLAHKSGHHLNVTLCQKIHQSMEAAEIRRAMEGKPILDIRQIEKILPHRYPFLLVDRVIELDPNNRAVGIKNVTYNEPFFTGHWPARPVMPGVLILEAMAQLAGIMLTQWQREGWYAMIVSMNDVKLRRPVVPGDQLWLESRCVRVKEKIASLRTEARVNRDLAAEAQMNFVLIKGESTD